MGASPASGGLPLCFYQARVQPRLRSLYRYTMCKLIANPLPEQSVSVRSLPSLSGIGRLAAQPPLREAHSDERFVAPSWSPPNRWSVPKEPSE
ncbi:MAG: hypothetical protein ACK56F_13185, partial [bacterium]